MRTHQVAVTVLALAVGLAGTGCESGIPRNDPSAETLEAIRILPDHARVVGMVDFQAMAQNESTAPFSGGPLSLEHLSGEHEARFREFISLTGFDPEADLDRAFFAFDDNAPESGVALAYASYDVDGTAEFVRNNVPGGAQESTYRDTPVFFIEDDDKAAMALVGGTMVIVTSNIDGLHAAIDRALGDSGGLEGNQRIMELVNRVSHLPSWFVVTGIEDADDVDDDFPASMAFATAISDAAIGFDASASALSALGFVTPRENVSAQDLANLLKGSVASLKLTDGYRDEPGLQSLVDGVEIERSGNVVRIEALVTNEVLTKMASDL